MGLRTVVGLRWLQREWKKLKEGNVKMLSSILATVVKDAAEGKYGEQIKSLYWGLAGKKTVISLGIFALWAMVIYVAIPVYTACGDPCGVTPEVIAQLQEYAAWGPRIAEVLLAVGLFDAAVRLEPPKQ